MEANWLNFHNKFNLILDSLRSAILLHNKTLLVKIIVGLYFASLVGSIFSSVSTLVISKLY